MHIKVATWNLHRCIGRDGVQSIERCVEALLEIDADVVALQEVETHPDDAKNMLAQLAGQTGKRAIPGMTMLRADACYGNAVLTSLPPSKVRYHDLSVRGREPRGALNVEFESGNCKIQLIATHLGLRAPERRQQVRRLLPLFELQNYDLVVLLGDFNEWLQWARPLRLLKKFFPGSQHRRCWPAHAPIFALDRIWVHPRDALCGLTVHKSGIARVASDHLPLSSKLKLECGSL